jgi:hypothetical protein
MKIKHVTLQKLVNENLKEKYIHVRKIHVQNLPKVAGY